MQLQARLCGSKCTTGHGRVQRRCDRRNRRPCEQKRVPSPLFRPTTIYKGDQVTAITVHTRGDQGSCGVRFAKGSEHTVFAFQSGQRLRTSLCNTWPISKSYASHTAEVESHFNRRK